QANKDQGGDVGSGPGSTARSAASSRPTRERDRDRDATASSVYDLDAAAESPVRSPIGGSSRRHGTDRSGNRDSMPPHSDSAEPPAVSSAGSAAQNQMKSKVTFSKGEAVAFRSKQINA